MDAEIPVSADGETGMSARIHKKKKIHHMYREVGQRRMGLIIKFFK